MTSSNRILDAALALAGERGLRKLTMDDVAARAEVGRMTVYRRFGDKKGLVEALTERESRRVLAQLAASTPPDAPVEEQIVEGLVVALRLAREHPLLTPLAIREPQGLLAAAGADGQALFALGCAFAAGRLRGACDAAELAMPIDEVAEILVRLCASFVLIPETILPTGDEDQLRLLARRLVAPVLKIG